eukprot:SAG11_NODE_2066_length_3868_cov_10.653224_3_plen_167_part_00
MRSELWKSPTSKVFYCERNSVCQNTKHLKKFKQTQPFGQRNWAATTSAKCLRWIVCRWSTSRLCWMRSELWKSSTSKVFYCERNSVCRNTKHVIKFKQTQPPGNKIGQHLPLFFRLFRTLTNRLAKFVGIRSHSFVGIRSHSLVGIRSLAFVGIRSHSFVGSYVPM